jgi:hypothetical protein
MGWRSESAADSVVSSAVWESGGDDSFSESRGDGEVSLGDVQARRRSTERA